MDSSERVRGESGPSPCAVWWLSEPHLPGPPPDTVFSEKPSSTVTTGVARQADRSVVSTYAAAHSEQEGSVGTLRGRPPGGRGAELGVKGDAHLTWGPSNPKSGSWPWPQLQARESCDVGLRGFRKESEGPDGSGRLSTVQTGGGRARGGGLSPRGRGGPRTPQGRALPRRPGGGRPGKLVVGGVCVGAGGWPSLRRRLRGPLLERTVSEQTGSRPERCPRSRPHTSLWSISLRSKCRASPVWFAC